MTQPGNAWQASPCDCTLLICVPLDRGRFFSDLERADKEFARNFRREYAALNDDALWRQYEPYADLAKEVAARAGELGVHVIERATLADFHREICRRPVCTLVAHWRSARFRAEDIADAAAVRAYLEQKGYAGDPEEALNALLDAMAGEDEENAEGSAGYEAARQYAWQTARIAIDAALGDAVRGGAAVEFAEGFRAVGHVLETIPAAYSGLLDLTVCQSVMLGEEVKRKCRRCLVLTGVRKATMDYRFALYRQVIELLAAKPQPFEICTARVREALMKRYGKKN